VYNVRAGRADVTDEETLSKAVERVTLREGAQNGEVLRLAQNDRIAAPSFEVISKTLVRPAGGISCLTLGVGGWDGVERVFVVAFEAPVSGILLMP
jgi:hypothetical protein